MVSKAWKNFVNESLTEFEENSSKSLEGAEDSSYDRTGPEQEPLKADKKSWCNTIDRSLGHAFKSFCRFVVSRTLNECSILNVSEIGPELFRDMIDRNFRHRKAEPVDSLPNYYRAYPRYARWHNRKVRTEKLFKTRKRCNLSCHRMLEHARRRFPEPPSKLVVVDVGRYEAVKPLNHFPTPSLAAAFE